MRQTAALHVDFRNRVRMREPDAAPAPILAPGRNCWRVPFARRAAMLADAADYFRNLDAALRQARRSILILGWDFDGRIRLRPDDQDSPELGDLLRALVEARPELELRVLVWSLALIHAPGASRPLLLGAPWMRHPRIQVRLDRRHPFYASHHQKMVCVDDAVAFAGGIDLTVMRWDDCDHAAEGALRVTPDGVAYRPVHDVQIAVDGDAARALGDLARERWQRATGETLEPVDAPVDSWPAGLAPDLTHVPVAISRTIPAWRRERGAAECGALTADAIAAARRAIYIETQYLTASSLSDLLGEALARPDGPEVLIVVTLASSGLLEQFAMGHNRDRLLRRLLRADRFGRLRVYYPVVPGADGDCPVLVHSKVMAVDDRFLRIGSSNFNNRSIALDTECDLALDAGYGADRPAIAAARNRLLAEHVGATPGAVARAYAEHGSLARAIDVLNRNGRGLRPYVVSHEGPTRPILGTGLLDPVRPLGPLWFLRPRG